MSTGNEEVLPASGEFLVDDDISGAPKETDGGAITLLAVTGIGTDPLKF